VKRKIIPGLAVAAFLFLSLCLAGRGDARRKEISSTRRVTIDGRSFVSDEFSPDEGTFPASHPVFSGRLKETPGIPPLDIPRLPGGLTAEHTLRMEGEGRPVDLAFGRLGTPGPSIRARLLASGWKTVSTGEDPRLARILETTLGKETTVVCLDEAEGTFLLFREVDR